MRPGCLARAHPRKSSAARLKSKTPGPVQPGVRRVFRPSETQLAQFGFQRPLEGLDIGSRRTIAGLWGNQSKLARLVDLPRGGVAVAKRDLAADDRARSRELVHGKGYLARAAGEWGRFWRWSAGA